jgi:two-component system CheB/CheR fusion protein
VEVIPELLAALDLLPEPTLIVTVEGSIIGANIAFARELRMPRDELAQRPLIKFAADPADAIHEYLRRCARSVQFLIGSLVLRPASGTPVKYRAEGAAYRADKTARKASVILMRLMRVAESRAAFIALNEKIQQLNAEISRRQRTEAALRNERETLQVTLSSIGDAVIVTDANGCITFINPVAEAVLRLPATQVNGRALVDIFRIANEETLEPVEDPTPLALGDGSAVGQARYTLLVRADGSMIPIDDSTAPILHDGKKIGAVLTFRDISERRRVEAALRDADRRKNEFLATLAHELRNPLAPIRNALQIMVQSKGDAAKIANLHPIIDRQLRQMVRLIDDLMDLSRITQGRLELRQERVDLDAVIQVAVETTRPLFESKRQQLRIKSPTAPIHVDADMTRLAQVFSNLLNNASKYSPPGTRVSITWERASTGFIVASVTDEGPGIPAEQLTRIFEMFVQGGRPGAREGLGIGLTLVKRIMALHGGTVEALSGEGHGSTFRVRLPVSETRTVTTEDAVHADGGGRQGSARVLIADDNKDAAQTLALMLETEGHEVRVTYDGSEALRVAEQIRPHVALLDIGMPTLDGYEVAQKLRATSWGKALYLVALTGWGQEQDKRRASGAGFNRHLVKPVDPQLLIDLVNHFTQSSVGGG